MILRAAALLALVAVPGGWGLGVDDAGAPVLEGVATDVVERTLVLDLWDEGDARRGYALRLAPDSDTPKGLEARGRAIHGAMGSWRGLDAFHLNATGGKTASDRGWDGLFEVSIRARLPNQPRTTLALLLVEDAPGTGALAVTTELRARVLELRAWAEPSPEGARLRAAVAGPKQPSHVEAVAGTQRWALAPGPDGWSAPWPGGVARVAVLARFADGGTLEGPEVARPGDAQAAQPPTVELAPAAAPPGAVRAEEGPVAATGTSAPAAPGRAPAAEPAERTALRAGGLDRALPAAPISLAFALAALAAARWSRRAPPSL